jgi:hypothetical protein
MDSRFGYYLLAVGLKFSALNASGAGHLTHFLLILACAAGLLLESVPYPSGMLSLTLSMKLTFS